jgi:NAD(P)-dependent dehydrogenase (short-subunit alcohol dehydrogenase family)
MQLPKPEGISTYHTKPYSAIDVTRPELSKAGKVVFITGGGSGLGLAFTEHFAKAGCTTIAITGRRQQVLDDAKQKIESTHINTTVLTLQGDVTNLDAVNSAFQQTVDAFGPIDILINNAGYLPGYEPIGKEGAFSDWWAGFEVNVKGSYNVLSAFLKASSQGATVINLTSAAVNAVVPGQSAYTASKVAATRMFEVFQVENPDYRVINVAPGVVLTDMHQKTIAAFDERDWPQLPLDDSKSDTIYVKL